MSEKIKAGAAYIEISIDDAKVKAGLRSLSATMADWNRKVGAIGMKGIMTAGATAVPLGAALKVFADFESQMSKVQSVTRATTEEIRKLRSQAIELGKTTFFTTSQVADAQKFLGMAGFRPEQIQAATPQVLDLALAGNMDLGTAADIATNISTPFRIAAEDLSRVNDVLAKAANSSNTNVMEMGQAFKYVAPAAAAAGQSLEECAAAMAILANSGMKGDMAGTGIRMMLTKLADTGIQKKLKESFDIDVSDQSGKMRPLLSILQDLKDATAEMGQTEAMGVFFDIFEARAGTAAITLANAGDAITDFRIKMIEAEGTCSQAAKTMSDNMKGDWIALMSAVEGVQIAVGDALNDITRGFLQSLTSATRELSNFISAHPRLIQVGGTAIAMFAGLASGLLTVCAGMKVIAAVSNTCSTIMNLFATATTNTTSSTTAETVAINANTAAVTKNTAAKRMQAILDKAKTAQSSIASAIKNVDKDIANLSASTSAAKAKLQDIAQAKIQAIAEVNKKSILPGLGGDVFPAVAAHKNALQLQKEMVKMRGQEIILTQELAAKEPLLAAAKQKRLSLENAQLAVTTKINTAQRAMDAQNVSSGFAAFSKTAEAAAASGTKATTVMGYLGAAIGAIPGWGWAIAGTAALMAITYWLTQVKDKTKDWTDDIRQFWDEIESRVKSSGKKVEIKSTSVQTDIRKFEVLQQFQGKEMNDKDFDLGSQSVDSLTNKYGDLGIVVNKAARTITFAAESQERFNKAAGNQMADALQKNLMEKEASFSERSQELAKLEAQRDECEKILKDSYSTVESLLSASIISSKVEKQIKELSPQIPEAKKEIQSLKDQMNEVRKGNLQSITKKGPEDLMLESIDRSKESQREIEQSEKKLADIRRTIERERRAQIENEIADVRELNKTYKELLETLLKTEKKNLAGTKNENTAKEIEAKIEEYELLLRTADAVEQERIDRIIGNSNVDNDSFDLGGKQSALVDNLKGLYNARQTGDNVEEWERKVDDAKFQIETAEIEKAAFEMQQSADKFREAVEQFELAKQEGDKEKMAVAAGKVNETRSKMESATSHYESTANKRTEKPFTDEDRAVGYSRSKFGEALLKLAAANKSGNQTKIEAAKVEVEERRKDMNNVEVNAITIAFEKALKERDAAIKNFDEVKARGGSYEEQQRAGERVSNADNKVKSAQANYESMIDNAKKGAEESKKSFSVSGSFSGKAAGMLSASGGQSQMIDLTKKIVENTNPKNKRDQRSVEEMAFPDDEIDVKKDPESLAISKEICSISGKQESLLRDISRKLDKTSQNVFA